MNKIWTLIMVVVPVISILTNRAGETAAALLESGEKAVTLLLTLLGTMTLWSGMMEILADTGDVARLGRGFRRIARPLFPGLTDDAAWEAMGMNLAANFMGLGNAATPAGIEAAKRLATQGQAGLNALAMLLALDNSSLQLIPTTVLTLRQAAGARDPGDVWGVTMIVSGLSTVVAMLLMRIAQRGGERHDGLNRRGHRGDGRVHRPAGTAHGQ